MKNTIDIQRSFGEVIVKACLPSVEDFAQKMSEGRTENMLNQIERSRHRFFYCEQLPNVYVIEPDQIFADFRKEIADNDLLSLQYSWGQVSLCNHNSLNIVPFFSQGIGTEKILKFTGIYTDESLNKAFKTLKHLVGFVKSYRQPLSMKFEIDFEDIDDKPLVIKL